MRAIRILEFRTVVGLSSSPSPEDSRAALLHGCLPPWGHTRQYHPLPNEEAEHLQGPNPALLTTPKHAMKRPHPYPQSQPVLGQGAWILPKPFYATGHPRANFHQ